MDVVAKSEDPIVAFFDGSGTDRAGRTIETLLELDHYQLEVDHSYIQWLFPTPEKSSFSFYAPQVTEDTRSAFDSRPELGARLIDAFRVILDFYGLALSPGDPLEVHEISTFSHRARDWVTDGNHNFLRISRILRSLKVLGRPEHAQAFLAYLEDLYLRRSEAIGLRTISYWRHRAGGDGEELPYE